MKKQKRRESYTPLCHPRLLENLFVEGDEEAELRRYVVKDKGE